MWNACACDALISLPSSSGCCGSWSGVRPNAACLHGFGKAGTFQTLVSGLHLLQLAREIALCCFNGRHLVMSLKSPPKGPIALKMLFLCCYIKWCTFLYIHFQMGENWFPPFFLRVLTLLFEDGSQFHQPTSSPPMAFFSLHISSLDFKLENLKDSVQMNQLLH